VSLADLSGLTIRSNLSHAKADANGAEYSILPAPRRNARRFNCGRAADNLHDRATDQAGIGSMSRIQRFILMRTLRQQMEKFTPADDGNSHCDVSTLLRPR
jgi:hypothetical protein